MHSPKVSIIIPNYNYAKYINKTIDSVLAQTYKNTEIIVVDDGSKDNSLEILASYGEKISVIKQKNQGVSLARNNGVKSSSGEFIAFLDADDIWLPEKLEKQMQKFFTNEHFGLVHCSMKYINQKDEIVGEIRDGQEGWLANEFVRFKRGVVIGAGSTGLTKREIFDEIGGFDGRLTTAADWDFGFRIAVKYQIGFVEEPLVLYRIHNSNMHSNIGVMEHDMMLNFEKAFSAEAANLEAKRRECYGNLHLTLAGSYFRSGKYTDFVRQTVKSLWFTPHNFVYFAKMPLRRFHRLKSNKELF